MVMFEGVFEQFMLVKVFVVDNVKAIEKLSSSRSRVWRREEEGSEFCCFSVCGRKQNLDF